MKTLVLAAIRCSLMFLIPTVTYGTSAQWDLDPISGDWNTAANWTPNDVPNGPGDIATFGLSNTTDVSISADTEVNSIIFTSEATSPYTITATSGLTLTISGAGITNTSGIPQPQNFVAEPEGVLIFTNSATAGNNVTITNNGADISGGFGGTTQFFDNSTAGNATITNERGGLGHGTQFFDSSTAGNATITNDGPNTLGNLKQLSGTQFFDRSTAGNATIINTNNLTVALPGITIFFDRSTAGNVTIINGTGSGGGTDFFDSSTAGNATLIVNGGSGGGNGGFIRFFDSSTGDTARVEVFGNGELNISGHGAPGVTVGSIEGDGNVFLGGNNLTVGSDNLSTTFSGVVQDGGFGGGTGGSLTKIGSGTLNLTGANTYTGDTTVNRGVLQVDGSITSNTFVNQRGRLAGTGTINGNLTNNGKVSPGSAGSPGMLTVTGNYTQAQYAALMIQLAGANAGEFSVLNILGTANLSGQLEPLLLNGFLPTVGGSFTFLQYGAVNGTLFMFNRNIDNLPEHWEVSYFPTFAVLTVAAGNVPVPDQASTLLLLMLGLSALLMCRRHLVCKTDVN